MEARNKAQKGPCYALEAVFSPPRVNTGPFSTAPGKPHKSRLFCHLNAYIPGQKFKSQGLGKRAGKCIDIVNKNDTMYIIRVKGVAIYGEYKY